jgi:hypothetical protein
MEVNVSIPMTRDDVETFCKTCPVRGVVKGEHGLENEHEDLKKTLHALEIRLVRIEVLVPFATAKLEWGEQWNALANKPVTP